MVSVKHFIRDVWDVTLGLGMFAGILMASALMAGIVFALVFAPIFYVWVLVTH